jgi:ADP-ribosylation factor-binding protein GGA
MEEEEKAAQSAKLQELIRRGGPEDLQEANRLMKIMAGYDRLSSESSRRSRESSTKSKVIRRASCGIQAG